MPARPKTSLWNTVAVLNKWIGSSCRPRSRRRRKWLKNRQRQKKDTWNIGRKNYHKFIWSKPKLLQMWTSRKKKRKTSWSIWKRKKSSWWRKSINSTPSRCSQRRSTWLLLVYLSKMLLTLWEIISPSQAKWRRKVWQIAPVWIWIAFRKQEQLIEEA